MIQKIDGFFVENDALIKLNITIIGYKLSQSI